MPGPDDDLDDLLSSLDADAADSADSGSAGADDGSPVADARVPRQRRSNATVPGFGDDFDDDEDSLPPIRTPLPPKPRLPSDDPIVAPAAFGPSDEAKPELEPSPSTAAVESEQSVASAQEPFREPPETLPPQVDAVANPLPPLHLEDELEGRKASSAVVGDPSRAFEMVDAIAGAEKLAPTSSDVDPTASLMPRRQGVPSIIWVGILSFAVAALGAVIYSSIDAFHPERAQTKELLAEREKRIAQGAGGRRASNSGVISVESDVGDAAVWFLLGRTPLESIALSSNQVHNLRLELEGQKTTFATIDRTHWTGDSDAQVAKLAVKLAKAGTSKGVVPAYEPEPAVRPPKGPAGKGKLLIESDPPGARVWLLIGFTPEAPIKGIEVGRRYELVVRKDGHRPGFTEVRASDWLFEGGEARRKVALPTISK